MAVCDICTSPGTGTLVSAEQMREAVFANGFNPFKFGLFPDIMGRLFDSAGVTSDSLYTHWKNTTVAQGKSDWNICSRCMAKLQPYLKTDKPPQRIKQQPSGDEQTRQFIELLSKLSKVNVTTSLDIDNQSEIILSKVKLSVRANIRHWSSD